ncbi:MAG: hypothetical protein RL427_444 [Bacteroidota bacterium]|jgi:hypothetical protein
MTIAQLKAELRNLSNVAFQLPDGTFVPYHFHFTEIGKVTKHFIDCGGKVRKEEVANFQSWEANDYHHQLHPDNLVTIIERSEKVLGLPKLDIEVEYQRNVTIGKYNLEFDGKHFLLTGKQTDCLAKENCGITREKIKVRLSEGKTNLTCCSNETNCC